MTNWKALCVELTDCLEKADWPHRYKVVFQQWTDIAHAALAQPEPEGPTDKELLELMPETMRDEFSYAAKVCSDAMAGRVKSGIFRVALNTAALEYARAVLARWGRPAPQPADGEVAELVAYQRVPMALLERLSPPQPVPLSERLPGPELCWWYEPDEDDDDGSGYGGSWTLLRIRGNTVSYTHWLPAHALPVPGEGE